MILIVSGLGLAIAAICSFLGLQYRHRWFPCFVRVAASIALVGAITMLFMARRDHGILEMFRQSDDAAVLLAMLIALVGLGTHYFRTLRGLDGFLFGLAALISFSAFLPAT